MSPSEKVYQAKLIRRFKKEGYLVLKLIQVQEAGYPDLLLLKPDGEIRFVEVKARRGRLSEIQKTRITQLQDMGFVAEVHRSEH